MWRMPQMSWRILRASPGLSSSMACERKLDLGIWLPAISHLPDEKAARRIDVAAPRGTPVYAVSAGLVHTARYNSGYGRIVVIDHGFGIRSRYAHNSSLLVRKGERVEAGQLIATVGSTGQSTGPHLHFELLIDGQAVDPLDYLPR